MTRNLYVYDTNLNKQALQSGGPNYEQEYADEAFEYLAALINNQARAQVIVPEDKSILVQAAMYAKNVHNGLVFEGLNPIKGFGVRWPIVQDVIGGTATDVTFDVAWANAATTRSFYSARVGAAAFDGVAFPASLTMAFSDVNNDPWPGVVFGVISGGVTPAPRQFLQEINRNPLPVQNIEMNMRTTEMAVARTQPTYVPHDRPYKNGFWISNAALGAQYTNCLCWTFISSSRAKTLTAAAAPNLGRTL